MPDQGDFVNCIGLTLLFFHCYVLMDNHYHLKGKEVSEGIETLQCKGSRNNKAKKVAIYLIKRYSGLGNQEIGELFGGIHYSAVSKSSGRLEKEMVKDRDLQNLVKDLVSHVKT